MSSGRKSPAAVAGEAVERDPQRLLGFRLPSLANTWSALAAKRFSRLFGLKRLEARMLFVLGINEAVSLKALGQLAGVEKAYASRTIASLVESDLIAKTTDADDRRIVRLQLTIRGRQLFEAIMSEARTSDDELIGVLNGAEQRNLHNYLDRLGLRLDDLVSAERDRPQGARK